MPAQQARLLDLLRGKATGALGYNRLWGNPNTRWRCSITNQTRSYASLWQRVLAFALDYLVIVLYILLVVVVGLIINFGLPNLRDQEFGSPVSGQITGFLLLTLPVTSYFAFGESSAQQATWGKRKMHLKVIRTDGSPLSRIHALSRNLLKFVPWELAHTCIWQISFSSQDPSPLIMAGFILVWILVGANLLSLILSHTHQTLYDWLARTYVIRS